MPIRITCAFTETSFSCNTMLKKSGLWVLSIKLLAATIYVWRATVINLMRWLLKYWRGEPHLYFIFYTLTLGDEILRYTMMGAKEVLASCDGWLMVSQSSTTSCRVRASSNIRSISAWTSAIQEDLEFERSIRALLLGLLRRLRLAREISALTLVMITLWRRRRWLFAAHPTQPSREWGSCVLLHLSFLRGQP